MIEVDYFKEQDKVKVLLQEVQAVVKCILQVLDAKYGQNRDKYETDGGYAIVKKSDISFDEAHPLFSVSNYQERCAQYITLGFEEYLNNKANFDYTPKLIHSDFSLNYLLHNEGNQEFNGVILEGIKTNNLHRYIKQYKKKEGNFSETSGFAMHSLAKNNI